MAIAALDLSRHRGERSTDGMVVGHGAALRAAPQPRVFDLLRVAIALLLVAQLGRLQLFFVGVKDVPLQFNDLVVLGVVAAAAVAALRRRSLCLDGPATAALVFASIGLLSAALAVPRFGLSGFQFVFSIAFLLRWLAYFGLYLAIINFARRVDAEPLWRTLEGVILVFAGFGIFQSAFLPGFAQIVYPDQLWDVQGRRLVSTFLDPNFAGGFIAMGLIVLLARLSFGVKVPYWKLLLLFAALLLTISRSAFIAFVTGAAVITLVRGHSRRLVRFWSLLVLVVTPFVPLVLEFANQFGRFSLSGSAMTRIVLWSRAITVFLDNPILGIGFNTYPFVQEAYGWKVMHAADTATDGGLLFIAVLTGLVGVSVYVVMLFLVVRRCRRIWLDSGRRPEERGHALGVAAATIAIVVHSIFLNSLLYIFIAEALWVLWGSTFLLTRPLGAFQTKAESTVSAAEERRAVLVG